jgi:hypothetical protein
VAARARVTCGELIMTTLTILALIEMFDESVIHPMRSPTTFWLVAVQTSGFGFRLTFVDNRD